jgi:hypothetical protein
MVDVYISTNTISFINKCRIFWTTADLRNRNKVDHVMLYGVTPKYRQELNSQNILI